MPKGWLLLFFAQMPRAAISSIELEHAVVTVRERENLKSCLEESENL